MQKESLWTKCKRIYRYYYNKAIREKGTPEYIAKGWALGVFIGFAIPFGLQLMVSIPLSFAMKCSKIGATVGTLVTNHFTIFVIYPFQTWMGNRVICGNLSWSELTVMMNNVIEKSDYKTLFNLGMEIVLSFLLGGLILAVVSTPFAYILVKKTVIQYRAHKEKLALERAQKQNEVKNGNRTAN